MQIHDKLRQYEKHSPTPVLHSAACLAEDVSAVFTNKKKKILVKLELNVRVLKVYFQQDVAQMLWTSDVSGSKCQLAEELQNGPLEDDERELLLLLNTPHLKVRTHVLPQRF